MARVSIILAITILTIISSTLAQIGTCEDFAGYPKMCAGIFPGKIWVPPGFNQSYLAESLIASGAQASVAAGEECTIFAVTIACSATFRACGSFGLPLPLCPDYCAQANLACKGITAFNCSEIDPVFSGPLWQAETNRTGLVETCQMANRSEPELPCPYPFIQSPSEKTCVMKCPPTGADDKNFNDNMWISQRVLAPIAFVILGLLIPPFWAIRSFQSEPSYVVYWMISLFMAAFFDILGKWNTWTDYICLDKWTVRDESYIFCGLSVIGTHFFRNSSLSWVSVVMYKISLKLSPSFSFKFQLFGQPGPFPKSLEAPAFHLFCWGYPGICLIIAYFKGWVNASGGAFSCYIITDALDGWVGNIMDLMPLTLGIALNAGLIGFVCYKIFKDGFELARNQWRILFMSFSWTIQVFLVIVFSWDLFSHRKETREAFTDYLTCILRTGSSKLCPPLKKTINRDFQLTTIILTELVPSVAGAVFLNSWVWSYWRGTLTGKHFMEMSETASASIQSVGTVSNNI